MNVSVIASNVFESFTHVLTFEMVGKVQGPLIDDLPQHTQARPRASLPRHPKRFPYTRESQRRKGCGRALGEPSLFSACSRRTSARRLPQSAASHAAPRGHKRCLQWPAKPAPCHARIVRVHWHFMRSICMRSVCMQSFWTSISCEPPGATGGW